MKKKALYFTKNNARMLQGDDIDMGIKNLVLNPDTTGVTGIPPHYWTMKDGQIVSMSNDERKERDNHIKENGADNAPAQLPVTTETSPKSKWVLAIAYILGFITPIAIHIIKHVI